MCFAEEPVASTTEADREEKGLDPCYFTSSGGQPASPLKVMAKLILLLHAFYPRQRYGGQLAGTLKVTAKLILLLHALYFRRHCQG